LEENVIARRYDDIQALHAHGFGALRVGLEAVTEFGEHRSFVFAFDVRAGERRGDFEISRERASGDCKTGACGCCRFAAGHVVLPRGAIVIEAVGGETSNERFGVLEIAAQLGLAWQPFGRGDLASTFGPEDLLDYIYALFHSSRYREQYADSLRSNFPRVLAPADRTHFSRWGVLGRELIDLHLLRASAAECLRGQSQQEDEIQQYRAGGYVALRKWLQPPHRSPANPRYAQIVTAIARTLEIMHEIDDIAS